MNNNIPLVSVICDVYNHGPYLKKCLDGFVSQQTTFLFEVLIHDDASTDNSQSIIEQYEKLYPNLIKPIYQKENQYSQKISIWKTYQFPRAKGKYIALCEGDDYWTDPLKLQKQVEVLEHKDLGLVYSLVRRSDNNEVLGKALHNKIDLYYSNCISTLTTLFRKNLLDKYLDSDLSSRVYLMSDYPMWLFFNKYSKIHCIEEELGVYSVLESSASHSKSKEKQLDFVFSSFQVVVDFSSRLLEDEECYEVVNYRFTRLILSSIKNLSYNYLWKYTTYFSNLRLNKKNKLILNILKCF